MIGLSEDIYEQIGYGTLDLNAGYDYTLSIEISIPASHHWGAIQSLEYQVATAVQVWLLYHAPSGTRTSIVCAVEN